MKPGDKCEIKMLETRCTGNRVFPAGSIQKVIRWGKWYKIEVESWESQAYLIPANKCQEVETIFVGS